MNEPMVTLTDFLITALAGSFADHFWRTSALLIGVRANFFAFFLSIAMAAFLGGLVHGFLPDASDGTTQIFWVLTLFCVGVTSYNIWLMNFHLLGGENLLRVGRWAARVLFALYVLILFGYTQQFYIAILSYIPAALILFLLLLSRVARHRRRADVFGVVGLILTFVAAYIQQSGFSVHPTYLDHNTFYHIVQALGLYGLFAFAKEFSKHSMTDF
jgi:hypothetical protein